MQKWLQTNEQFFGPSDRIVFSGKGYGHGVGMCQWGAKGLAQRGRSAERIVKKYFSMVRVGAYRYE